MMASEQYVIQLEIKDLPLLLKILEEGRITQEEYAQLLGVNSEEAQIFKNDPD